ncbi:MAG: ABC transporter ATP-binding protein [Thermodesulfobacteriota bacterium]|jgi:branched-chain amino acid transport system ATP-binding protein
MHEALLELQDLHFNYGGAKTLRGISFKLIEGDIICIIGANGAGKTTTLRIVSGLEKPASGEIRFQKQRIDGLPPKEILSRGITLVPEQGHLFRNMTVFENLMMGAYLLKEKETITKELDRVYSYFPRLAERARQRAGSLSGGERQMLAVGRALMSKPRVLMMDEPSSGLAPQLVEMVGQLILDINGEGISIVLVEQNAEMALNIARYGYVLERGSVALEGETRVLINNDLIKQAYLGV